MSFIHLMNLIQRLVLNSSSESQRTDLSKVHYPTIQSTRALLLCVSSFSWSIECKDLDVEQATK